VQHFIVTYGYLAVFVLMLAESACIPIPSEVVMLFGGAMAAGGVVHGSHPSLVGIIAAGALGNVTGSFLAWWAGRHWGQAAVRNFGRRVHIHERDIDRATEWFERRGPIAVLVGRVVPVVRTFISLPAGFANMPALRFGLYTLLGCLPWTAGLGVAGYQLGSHWDKAAKAIQNVGYVVVALLVIAIVAVVIMRRRRRAEHAPSEAGYPPQGYPPQPEYGYPAQPVYPFPHEAPYPQGPSPAERFWAQSWESLPSNEPPPDRAVRPQPVSYQQSWPRAPQPQPTTAAGGRPAPANRRPPQPQPANERPAQPQPARPPSANGRPAQPAQRRPAPQPQGSYPPPRNQRPNNQWGG
jgi:membrane protein DedA with SNARE-associated domain